MAFIVVGEGQELHANDWSWVNDASTLLYSCDKKYSGAEWVKHNDFSTDSHALMQCGASDVHQALDRLALVNKHLKLTVIWYYQPLHSEDDELLGALLRASLCSNSRLVVVLGDSTLVSCLNSLWISDYVYPVIVPNIRSITVPVWRGQLLVRDQQVYAEITDQPASIDMADVAAGSIEHHKHELEGACMETVSKVYLSTIHASMLGHMYRLKLSAHSLQLSQFTGYVVRMVVPQYPSSVPLPKVECQATRPEDITTTDQWVAYVLKENLSKPDVMPAGPVYYKYFLIYPDGGDDSTYFCYEFDVGDLASLIVAADVELTLGSHVSAASLSDTPSVYDDLRKTHLSPSALTQYKQTLEQAIQLCLSSDHLEKYLKEPQSWLERTALQEHTKRCQALIRRDVRKKSDDSGKVLTLDSVRKFFTTDGVAVDPKYRLLTGNCEKEGLREFTWPQAVLHYGPGISYHREEEMVKDPRIPVYKAKPNFSETASLFTTPVMPSSLNPPARKRETSAKSDLSQGQRSSKVSKQRGSEGKGRESQREPARQVSTKDIKVCSKPKTQPPADTSYMNTREQRAQRNRRNKQKMESAVVKALAKKGIKSSHNLFEAYKKELFDLSMRGVRELKTSFELEKKMKEISEVCAPAAILTVDMKSK